MLRLLLPLFSIGGITGVLLFVVVMGEVHMATVVGLLSPDSHIAALAAAVLTWVGRSIRSQVIAEALGEKLDFGTALKSQLVADAGGFLTPARLGSEAGKLFVLRQSGLRIASGAAINCGEILWEATVVMLLVVGILVALPTADAAPALGACSYVVGVGGVILGSLGLARLPEAVPAGMGRWGLSEGRWRQVRESAQEYVLRTRGLFRMGRETLFALFVVTAATIAVRLAILPLLLGKVPDEGGTDLVVWPLLLLYGGALLPLPGGGGAIELGFLAAFRGEFPPALLAASLLWWRVYTHYLSAAIGGVILLTSLHQSYWRGQGSSSSFPMK